MNVDILQKMCQEKLNLFSLGFFLMSPVSVLPAAFGMILAWWEDSNMLHLKQNQTEGKRLAAPRD